MSDGIPDGSSIATLGILDVSEGGDVGSGWTTKSPKSRDGA